MGITIGKKREAGYDNPVGMLRDCHRRVERFLADLQDLAQDEQLGAGGRQRLEAALKYFREAAPRHTADEEESLFPRLRARGQDLSALERLEADHAEAEPLHAKVEAMGQAWLAGEPVHFERLRETLARLAVLYAAHIAIEDRLFPELAGALTPDDLEGCAREMALRRGVDFDAWREAVRQLA